MAVMEVSCMEGGETPFQHRVLISSTKVCEVLKLADHILSAYHDPFQYAPAQLLFVFPFNRATHPME